MVFDFFRKKRDRRRTSDGGFFDADRDEVGFDELDASGEFISDERMAAPPRQERASPAPPRSAGHDAPLPRDDAPRPVQPSPVPQVRPVTPSPAVPPNVDETVLYDPRRMGPRAASNPATAAAVPIHQAPPAPVVRPAGPMDRAPSPLRPAPPPPPPVDCDKTMVLSGPTGAACVVAWLVIANGPSLGKDFRLSGGTARLGLDPGCDVFLGGDPSVSGRHAEISFRRGQFELRDLDSTNGTLINGTRVVEAVLRDNDRLTLGKTQLVFKSLSL